MTRQQTVAGQTKITSFSGYNAVNVHGDDTVQSSPAECCQPQLAQRNHYAIAGDQNYQIAEFTVPADPIRAHPQIVVTHPQITKLPPVRIPDEMSCSVLITVFCCLYLGIPSMIFAAQANSLRHTDPERALEKAKVARTLNITALILGTITAVVAAIYLGLYIHRLHTEYT